MPSRVGPHARSLQQGRSKVQSVIKFQSQLNARTVGVVGEESRSKSQFSVPSLD